MSRRYLAARRPLASLLLTALLAGCGSIGASTTTAPRTATVGRSQQHVEVTLTGLVVPAVQSKLNFRVPGVFVGYKVAIGEHVTACQELATIDAPDLDMAVASVKYDVANAQALLDSAQARLDAVQSGRAASVAQAS